MNDRVQARPVDHRIKMHCASCGWSEPVVRRVWDGSKPADIELDEKDCPMCKPFVREEIGKGRRWK